MTDGVCFFRRCLKVCRQTGRHIHAYVLMSNYYHLLLETLEAGKRKVEMCGLTPWFIEFFDGTVVFID